MLPLRQRLVALAGLAVVACAQSPSDAECLDLLDRYTLKLLRENDPELSEAELLRLQQEAHARASEDPLLGSCQGKLSRAAYDCAMKAPNTDEMERCMLR